LTRHYQVDNAAGKVIKLRVLLAEATPASRCDTR
jgi:hypothetical protein